MLSDFHPTSIDLIIYTVLLLSGFFGFWRGIVKEIFAIAGWAAASLALLYGFIPLQPVTRDIVHNAAIADFITGTLLFAGTLILVSVITHFLSKWVKDSAFGAADRSLGFLFGILRGALIISLIFFLYSSAEPDPEQYPETLQKAESLEYLEQGTNWLIGMIQKTQNLNHDDMDSDEESPKSITKDAAKDKESEYKDIEKEGMQPPAP